MLIKTGKIVVSTVAYSNILIKEAKNSYNYSNNKTIDNILKTNNYIGEGKYINGQGRSLFSKDSIEYGYNSYQTGSNYNSGYNGCGPYSMYNSLITLGDYEGGV